MSALKSLSTYSEIKEKKTKRTNENHYAVTWIKALRGTTKHLQIKMSQ